jgi:anhydro-N-acetylmuramic acid kinase
VDLLDRLQALREKPERLVLGLMSGMSTDGLDLALVRIRDRGEGRDVTILAAETDPYPPDLVRRIRAGVEGRTRDVCRLDFDLAEAWSTSVLAFLLRHGVAAAEVDLLGSHGQTLDHVPRGAGTPARTLQVGDGDVLAERTGLLTVSDFRVRDVAAGGEGAPLVPLADWLLFAEPEGTSACQNLGSIGNVTVVTPRREDVEAFDTGPANALIDAFARRCPEGGGDIDRDGRLSAGGRVVPEALRALGEASAAFRLRPPPRSAGYDDFGPPLAARVAASFADLAPRDLLRTGVEFTALTLEEAYRDHVLPRHRGLRLVRATGGGVHNPTLMAAIRRRLDALGLGVEVPPAPWPDAKEAVAFALLADETARGRPGNLPRATGARRAVVLGKLSP